RSVADDGKPTPCAQGIPVVLAPGYDLGGRNLPVFDRSVRRASCLAVSRPAALVSLSLDDAGRHPGSPVRDPQTGSLDGVFHPEPVVRASRKKTGFPAGDPMGGAHPD